MITVNKIDNKIAMMITKRVMKPRAAKTLNLGCFNSFKYTKFNSRLFNLFLLNVPFLFFMEITNTINSKIAMMITMRVRKPRAAKM